MHDEIPLGFFFAAQHCAVESETATADGTTVALTRVAADQIRPLARNEIHHARPFTLAAH